MSDTAINPVAEFITTLQATPPDAPTSSGSWTAHEITAHLVAALEETSELIEDVLNEQTSRPTRGFDEREAPYRQLPDPDLRAALPTMIDRALTALAALAEKGPDATFEFFGRPFTAAQLQTHAGSEFSLHRWDICGDDAIGDALLSEPALTSHAVDVLNTLPMLDEAPGNRAANGELHDIKIVLRTPAEPDIALIVGTSTGTARLELSDGPPMTDGDILIECDAAQRLLTLWGRFSPTRPITATGDTTRLAATSKALWPDPTSRPILQ